MVIDKVVPIMPIRFLQRTIFLEGKNGSPEDQFMDHELRNEARARDPAAVA